MKINYENYLHKIDSALAGKTQKDLYMTYFMIIAGIFAFSYLLFWDTSVENFKTTHREVVNLQNNITSDKRFLQMNPISKITKLEKEINHINQQIENVKDTNAYIRSKIETISSLIYDERSWGKYLNSISTNAQKYHVKLLMLTNEYAKSESAFGHILNISIKFTGNFQNTLKFINSLEQNDLVVDIHDLTIQATNSLESDLNISVWGITY